MAQSHPSRVRELKLNEVAHALHGEVVAPLPGA